MKTFLTIFLALSVFSSPSLMAKSTFDRVADQKNDDIQHVDVTIIDRRNNDNSITVGQPDPANTAEAVVTALLPVVTGQDQTKLQDAGDEVLKSKESGKPLDDKTIKVLEMLLEKYPVTDNSTNVTVQNSGSGDSYAVGKGSITVIKQHPDITVPFGVSRVFVRRTDCFTRPAVQGFGAIGVRSFAPPRSPYLHRHHPGCGHKR